MQYLHSFRLLALFAALLVAGCGGAVPRDTPVAGGCMTDDGWADWSGLCMFGRAEGKGIATYDHKTITGTFASGTPQGEVTVNWGSGGTYVGTIEGGEPHGYGTSTEAWGEAYAGGWDEGYRDGEGVFTTQDGQKMRGLWRRGKLLGGWYQDVKTGCEVWWAVGSDPNGRLSWDGNCRDGKAEGQGTIQWNDEEPGAAAGTTVVFTGALSAGKLDGPGVWKQTNRHSNVINDIIQQGTWRDGSRTGFGRNMERSKFLDGSFSGAFDSYVGQFENGDRSGTGKRIDSKTYPDGGVELFSWSGRFIEGGFKEGVYVRQRSVAEGEDSVEISRGLHDGGQFFGQGSILNRRKVDSGNFVSRISFPASATEGGKGFIRFADGDVFNGSFGTSARFFTVQGVEEGTCILHSIEFVGRCTSSVISLSDYRQKACLAPVGKPDVCLKQTGEMIF